MRSSWQMVKWYLIFSVLFPDNLVHFVRKEKQNLLEHWTRTAKTTCVGRRRGKQGHRQLAPPPHQRKGPYSIKISICIAVYWWSIVRISRVWVPSTSNCRMQLSNSTYENKACEQLAMYPQTLKWWNISVSTILCVPTLASIPYPIASKFTIVANTVL